MKKMKWLVSVTALTLAVILSCSSCSLSPESQNPLRPDNMIPMSTTNEDNRFVTMLENDQLIFQMNRYSTDIKVIDKQSGREWSSEGTFAGSTTQGDVLELTYYDNTGNAITMNTMTDCVERGQYAITQEDNRVKVQYCLGDIDVTYMAPIALSPERYQELYGKLSEENRFLLESYYFLVDFNAEEWSLRAEEEIAAAKVSYPLAVNQPWYYMVPSANDTTKQEIDAMLTGIGYTEEDLKFDNKGTDYEASENAEFNFNVYYELDGADFIVTIPEQEIYHSEDFVIEKFSLLKNFLSVDQNEQGYYFLPDGSGAIMNFYNGTQDLRNANLYLYMYGMDESNQVVEKTADNAQAVFPVFGANVGAAGCFAIIEEGEAFAGLTAAPGSESVAPMLYPEFRINERARIQTVTSTADKPVYFSMFQFQRYLGDLKVRYKFLSGENASYSGMAKAYRNYLFGDRAVKESSEYPMTAEIVGTIDVKKNFLGIGYNSTQTLTTYDRVTEIAKDLQANGVGKLNLKLSGWFGTGIRHGYADTLDPIKEAGGGESLTNMLSTLTQSGVQVYPDVDVQNVYANAVSGKPGAKDLASLLTKDKAILYDYDPANFQQDYSSIAHYALNADGVIRNLEGFLTAYEAYPCSAVSLRNVGKTVFASYNEKYYYERQTTLKMLVEAIANVKDKGYRIMGSTGDAPFVPYLDAITEMPVTSNDLDQTDYSVPFTAMVLSGYVDYSYQPINLSNNSKTDLLHLIEAAAGAQFTFTGSAYSKLSMTDFTQYYATNYDDVKESCLQDYKMLAEAMDGIYGVPIEKHERLADQVFQTTFQNGKYVIVNYSDKDFTFEGQTVKAANYLKGGAVSGN